jgi:glycine/D-amino acid oxidase-like deaminating enzyme
VPGEQRPPGQGPGGAEDTGEAEGTGSRAMDRRRFLELTGAGTGALLAGASALRADDDTTPSANRPPTHVSAETPAAAPAIRTGQAAPDVLVVGAGAFGGWTALNLQRLGATVELVDAYGPGNSRATSGGETRGVRSSYGDQPHGLLWGRWAREAMRRWKAFDEEWSDSLLPRLYFETGDIILRAEDEPFLVNTRKNWDELGVAYEMFDADEVRRRWDIFDLTDITVGLYEPDAGVVRARRAMEAVAEIFKREGGTLTLARAAPGRLAGDRLDTVLLDGDDHRTAGQFVFALGPWFPQELPELMARRLRTFMGYVYYFGTPPGDDRFTYPNCPSWNYRGVTGWAALGIDNRGFRVRTGGRAGEGPDDTPRVVPDEGRERGREFVRERFPLLADAPMLETRSCFYESSIDRNFFIDLYPERANMWLAGGGSAEAFKQGPVLGEYIARRVLDQDLEPELAEGFRLKEEEFEEEELTR